MSVSYLKCRSVAFFCLVVPTLFFLVGFLKWYIGIPAAIFSLVAYFFALRRRDREEEETIIISPLCLVALGLIALGWCYLSGLGNLYYQSGDWSARNAIFRDLIYHRWPVVYEVKNAALVYYVGFWLPPAAVGKLVMLLGGSLESAFFIGNIVLWIYTAVYVFLAFLLTAVFVRAKGRKMLFAFVLIFIFFSGLDIVGSFLSLAYTGKAIGNHIEWWPEYYQFSSMATCLGWVFNQAVISWLATACFINESDSDNYAFIVVLCAAGAPLPAVGLGIYMIGKALVGLVFSVRQGRLGLALSRIFTVQNIISALVIFPIYLLYYATNLALGEGMSRPDINAPADKGVLLILALLLFFFAGLVVWRRERGKSISELVLLGLINGAVIIAAVFNHNLRLTYIVTVFLEGVVYLIFLLKDNKREPLYYLTLIVFLIAPLVRVGTSADFCMRASIPAVLILMCLCARYLFKRWRERGIYRFLSTSLVLLLLLGSVTPIVEFSRGISEVAAAGRLDLVNDDIVSFDRVFEGELADLDRNFIAYDYGETLFFSLLAK